MKKNTIIAIEQFVTRYPQMAFLREKLERVIVEMTNRVKAGGKIYKFKGGFNHAKTIVIDDDYAVVGTVNIDYRSMFLHFECCNLLMKTTSISEIKKDFEETLLVSHEVDLNLNKKRNPFKKILSFILSIFGPLF